MKRIKSILTILLLSLSLFTFLNCACAKKSANEITFSKQYPFTIGAISFQKWIAGTEEGGSGIRFEVSISNIEEGVTLKDVYFRNMIVPAQVSPIKTGLYLGHFTTSNQKDFIMDANPIKEAQNTPKMDFPFQLEDNEAVLSADYNGKMLYVKLSSISEKPVLALPGANPTMGDDNNK